jgi:hypothetical protein
LETNHETQSNLPVCGNNDDDGKLRNGASPRPELRKGFKLAWSLNENEPDPLVTNP